MGSFCYLRIFKFKDLVIFFNCCLDFCRVFGLGLKNRLFIVYCFNGGSLMFFLCLKFLIKNLWGMDVMILVLLLFCVLDFMVL